jgi:hypothetical protein
MKQDDVYLAPSEAGRLFEPPLSPARIRQLFDAGELAGLRTAGGMRLIRRSEIERLASERKRRTPVDTQVENGRS